MVRIGSSTIGIDDVWPPSACRPRTRSPKIASGPVSPASVEESRVILSACRSFCPTRRPKTKPVIRFPTRLRLELHHRIRGNRGPATPVPAQASGPRGDVLRMVLAVGIRRYDSLSGYAERTWRIPVRRAAPLPRLLGCVRTIARHAAKIGAKLGPPPSSTTTIARNTPSPGIGARASTSSGNSGPGR